jgi:hypothetical protein
VLNLDLKVKLALEQTVKAQTRKRIIAQIFPLISTLGGVSVVMATLRQLYPVKVIQYPLYRRAGGTPGSIWTDVEILASALIRSPDRPVRSNLEVQTLTGILQTVKLAIETGYLCSAINSSEMTVRFPAC